MICAGRLVALAEAGVADATIRLGHVGLDPGDARALGPARRRLARPWSRCSARPRPRARASRRSSRGWSGWPAGSGPAARPTLIVPAVSQADDRGVDRLFRTLVPDVTGRRSGHEIIHRLRRKWDLGHALANPRAGPRPGPGLADLHGPAAEVLERLDQTFAALAPESVAGLRGLVDSLAQPRRRAPRIELDLGFGRGIGFYTRG